MNPRLLRSFSLPMAAMVSCTICSLGGVAQTPPIEKPAKPTTAQLSQLYKEARDAFQKQDWNQAAPLFHSLSELCPGSKLALEADYYSVLSEVRGSSDRAESSLDHWLIEAGRVQRSLPDPKSFEPLSHWLLNAALLKSQFDRTNRRFEQAEERLRKLVEVISQQSNQTQSYSATEVASLWLELGNIMLEAGKDLAQSKECYQHCIDATDANDENLRNALYGLCLCELRQGGTELAAYLDKLEHASDTPDWIAKTLLLRSQSAHVANAKLIETEDLKASVERLLAYPNAPSSLIEVGIAFIDGGAEDLGVQILEASLANSPESPVATETQIRLARVHAVRGNWAEAARWSDNALRAGTEGQLAYYAFYFRGLSRARLGLFQDAVSDLQNALAKCEIDTSDAQRSLETTLHYELSESLYQLQRWTDAAQHWDWLMTNGGNPDAGSPAPAWLATVMLRRAEMLALSKRWDQAESAVSVIYEKFPECAKRREVDYLLARCWISKAKFDEARKVLERVAATATPAPDVLAWRAWWMIGETFLMQRDYQSALHAYQQVLGAEANQYWRSAARLQMGQCFEMIGDPKSAQTTYQQIIDDDAQGPFTSTARDRLLTLSKGNAPAMTAVEKTPGTKR